MTKKLQNGVFILYFGRKQQYLYGYYVENKLYLWREMA